ncbi:TPA: helix-turn-helix transcriptional regulator [Candidatus Scatenecus faecavium]|jgi:transcriptional regulator with XRE-family HTH domain|uniref:Helix-turn-helix transcriptional regulator n=1 Tax=Candidatus Scatenecus faecavium TaxID=2840915 RepID=A0A9D1FXB2_9BACT|nr:helix-turn-helix transcriptional regulator [Candidatus Scatenecus faecavium]
MDIRKIFGSNVRKYRIRKGFSQEKLAEFVDLGDKSISPIETGRSFIAIDK